MKIYAVLNENKICTGISQLSSEKNEPNMIEIPSANADFMWKKYENEKWSTEKFEPVSTAPIDEFTQLQQSNAILSQTLGNVTLENANLKQQVGTLSQTVANLMTGGSK